MWLNDNSLKIHTKNVSSIVIDQQPIIYDHSLSSPVLAVYYRWP